MKPRSLHVHFARLFAFLPAATILALAPGAASAQSAANFIVAIGAVQVIDTAGRARPAGRGGPLAPGDRIVTGADGLAQIRFSDGAMLSVRANSDLKIEAHSYRGESDSLATTVLQLVRGGLRAITGAVARVNRSGYKVVTPTATIGVRGTDFEAFYIPPPTAGGLAPPDEPGTYLRVTRGLAFLQTPQGDLDVRPQQVGFMPIATVPPRLLPQAPQFMLQPQRPSPGPGPAPRSQPPQRSEGGTGEPPVRQVLPGNLQQVEPGRVMSPQTGSPQLMPEATSPSTVAPQLTPGIMNPSAVSPSITAPTTSPTVSPGTVSPPAISSPMTAPSTAPTISPSVTSPSTVSTSPMLSPNMTAPPTVSPPR
jgi:hypothetical protein